MRKLTQYGLEQARAQLPRIVSEAGAGVSSVITRHGKPCAAVVPLQDLERLRASRRTPRALLQLRGTGRGMWDSNVGKAIADLRDEWGAA
jgi:prevent-host-death family protein